MTLGNRIQEIRTARGMSQEQFGEMLDTTRQTVSKWELDQVIPDIRKMVAISRLFCVSTEELLLNVTTFEKEGLRFPCDVYRNTVSELGIRKCLDEWRKGVEYFVSAEGLNINIHTGKTEYIYSIWERDDDIYCGCSYNLPFELGVRSYGQFFRLRNYQDNSQDFCACHFDFDYKMPEEIKEIDYVKLGGNTNGESCALCWFVKRYREDEIVLDGCGSDEYIYRKDKCQYERFM